MDGGGRAATPHDFCTDVLLILDEQVIFLFMDLMETRVVYAKKNPTKKQTSTFLFTIPVFLITAEKNTPS